MTFEEILDQAMAMTPEEAQQLLDPVLERWCLLRRKAV